jgi:hypothetical protein
MATSSVVEAVCKLASEFRRRDDISIVTLLQQSGYVESPELVTEESVKAYLRQHPELIDSWAILSDDQRSSGTWYLNAPHAADPNVQWAVGFYPGTASVEYLDGPTACAAFIVRYVGRVHAS